MEWLCQSLGLNAIEMLRGDLKWAVHARKTLKYHATEGILHGTVVKTFSKLMSEAGGQL